MQLMFSFPISLNNDMLFEKCKRIQYCERNHVVFEGMVKHITNYLEGKYENMLKVTKKVSDVFDPDHVALDHDHSWK